MRPKDALYLGVQPFHREVLPSYQAQPGRTTLGVQIGAPQISRGGEFVYETLFPVETKNYVGPRHLRCVSQYAEILCLPTIKKPQQRTEPLVIRSVQQGHVQVSKSSMLPAFLDDSLPLCLVELESQRIGRLIPKEIWSNVRRTRGRARHDLPRRPWFLAGGIAQIRNIDDIALSRQHHSEGNRFLGITVFRGIAAGCQPFVVSRQGLQDGHAFTSGAWSGGTSIMPPRNSARKNLASLPLA